jgi:hypothetical protein
MRRKDMCKTFKKWVTDEYDWNTLADIANHGCVSGFSGLIYYSDTTKLYAEHKEDIWEMLDDDAESFGCASIPELIGTFNGAKHVSDDVTFENLLVWYAVEKVAWEVTDGEYQET